MDLQSVPALSPAEWIAVVSAAAACTAAGIAFWSLRTSRQALKVSLRQEQRLQSQIGLYLAEAYIRRERTERRRIYVFRVVVTNKADLPNSLRAADLEIRYVRDGIPGPMIAVSHGASSATDSTEAIQPLVVPCSIPARGVVAGALIFNVPDDVLSGADVESYRLSVSDALGRVTELESIILQERDDDEKVAQGNHSAPKQG